MTDAAPPLALAPALDRIGEEGAPVLRVDGFDATAALALATALAPFAAATNHYPGLRRVLGVEDEAAYAYVVALLDALGPYLGGAFDCDGFDLIEASFSMVTTPPERLTAVQRAPHFDSVDPDMIAILHYLTPTAGTAFYRHRASGIAMLSAANVDRYVAAAQATPTGRGYMRGSDAGWERIGLVEGRAGRVVAYPTRLLHSGHIVDPPGGAASTTPATGRVTTNIFIRRR